MRARTVTTARTSAKAGEARLSVPRKPRLKVYRTAIGFHDAYVAAPSQKAALAAWGATTDLFAIGGAEVVTDPALTAEPLASPGTVVKRTRGSLSEHLRAAKRATTTRARSGRARPAKPARPPKPRPSRDALAHAEAVLAALCAEAEAEKAAFDRREADLLRERKAAGARQRKAVAALERQLEGARSRYERAIERWREQD